MRMSSGVEWGVHCCVTLGWLEEPTAIGRLAEWFGLPSEYLKKRLQALVRAGVLESVPGQAGGYTLAKSPESITLMDVVAAVEGREPAFRCTEIRRDGRCGQERGDDFRHACGISVVMQKAEQAWRRELASTTIADLMADAPEASADGTRRGFARMVSTGPGSDTLG